MQLHFSPELKDCESFALTGVSEIALAPSTRFELFVFSCCRSISARLVHIFKEGNIFLNVQPRASLTYFDVVDVRMHPDRHALC